MKLLWLFLSGINHIAKGKIKPLYRYFRNKKFRNQCDQIYQYKGFFGITKESTIPFDYIVPSHRPHYSNWIREITSHVAKRPPITVTWTGKKWFIIDGNHRFFAMKRNKQYDQSLVKVLEYTKVI